MRAAAETIQSDPSHVPDTLGGDASKRLYFIPLSFADIWAADALLWQRVFHFDASNKEDFVTLVSALLF